MRTWIVAAALSVCVLPPAEGLAMELSRPYEQIAASHWAYQAVSRLEKQGYVTGSPAGAFSGTRKLTRYAFATAVERIYRSIQPRVLSATQPGGLPDDLRSFRRLLDEFSPEIATLGPDVTEIRNQLETLDQRVIRLQKDAVVETENSPASDLLASSLGGRRGFGLQNALAEPRAVEPVGVRRPGSALLPFTNAFKSGATAGAGPLSLGFGLEGPDPLLSAAGLPLEDPADVLSYQGELNLDLNKVNFRAFYGRQAGNWDRFNLTPYSQLGASTAVGGGLSGPLGDRLNFELEAASLTARDSDAPGKARYIKGGLAYHLGRYTFGLGYELGRLGQFGNASNFSTLSMGVGRNFGKNARLDFRYQIVQPERGASETGGTAGSSSAITQISVKF